MVRTKQRPFGARKLQQAKLGKSCAVSKPWKKPASPKKKNAKSPTDRFGKKRTVEEIIFVKRDKNDSSFDTIDNQEVGIKFVSYESESAKSIASAEDWEYLEEQSLGSSKKGKHGATTTTTTVSSSNHGAGENESQTP